MKLIKKMIKNKMKLIKKIRKLIKLYIYNKENIKQLRII